MKFVGLMFGGSALLALVLALAARIDVPQTVAATEVNNNSISVGKGRQFDDSWNDLQTSTVPKTASLASTEPKPIQTIRVEPESEVVPPIILSEEKVAKPKYHEPKDVCQRHKMHKVYRGRSWHCRK